VIPQWRDTSVDMTERRSTATSRILLSMKLRHSLVREEGSLALPRKPQLLEVSGQALNRHGPAAAGVNRRYLGARRISEAPHKQNPRENARACCQPVEWIASRIRGADGAAPSISHCFLNSKRFLHSARNDKGVRCLRVQIFVVIFALRRELH
jgi:hypothetical protein